MAAAVATRLATIEGVLSADGSKLAATAHTGLHVWVLGSGAQIASREMRAEKARFAEGSGGLSVGEMRVAPILPAINGTVQMEVAGGPPLEEEHSYRINKGTQILPCDPLA